MNTSPARSCCPNVEPRTAPAIATIAAVQSDGLRGVQHSLGDGALRAIQGDAESGILPSQGTPGRAAGYDYQGLAGAMAATDPLKALQLQQMLVKQGPKFSTAPQYDQNGNAFVMAEDGTMKRLDGVRARDKLEEVRLGDKVAFRSPYSTEMQGSMPIGQSADSRASNAIGWANNALAQQRFAMDQDNQNKPQWIESLGGFADPRTQRVMPAKDMQGNPIEGAGKAMTEDQGKATGWLVQAQNALKNMDGALALDPSASKPGINDAIAAIPSFGFSSGVANLMRGDNRQKFMQASSSLSEALLRAATGAGVNANEAKQKIDELTPVIGDTDAVIAQKREAIPIYIESLKVRAGPGAKKAAGISNTGGAQGSWGGTASDPLGLFK